MRGHHEDNDGFDFGRDPGEHSSGGGPRGIHHRHGRAMHGGGFGPGFGPGGFAPGGVGPAGFGPTWFGPAFGPGGFGRGFGPRFGRGPKAGRGDVKLAIVILLAEEPRHGYQIIQELGTRSNGMWRPSPGSIYPTLQAMEDEGLVTAEIVEGKKVYSLSESGKAYLAANARSSPPWEEIAGDPRSAFFELRREIEQLGVAVMQVGQAGREDQLRRAMKLLSDARKSVYRILSEDDPETSS